MLLASRLYAIGDCGSVILRWIASGTVGELLAKFSCEIPIRRL